MLRWAVVVLAVWGAGMLAVACGGGGRTASNGRGGTATGTGASAVEMEADDFYFEPDKLEGRTGQTITVTVKNEGEVAHTFTIDELHVDQTVNPGQEATVTFMPGEVGTLNFYCRFHRSRGMQGEIEVTGG